MLITVQCIFPLSRTQPFAKDMLCRLYFVNIEVEFRGERLPVSDTPELLPFCPKPETLSAAVVVVASFLATLNDPTERCMSTPVATVEDDLWLSPDDEHEWM